MEIRARAVKKENNDLATEDQLLKFCNEQISKMRKHLKLETEEGFPAFFEINQALMGYQNIYLYVLIDSQCLFLLLQDVH